MFLFFWWVPWADPRCPSTCALAQLRYLYGSMVRWNPFLGYKARLVLPCFTGLLWCCFPPSYWDEDLHWRSYTILLHSFPSWYSSRYSARYHHDIPMISPNSVHSYPQMNHHSCSFPYLSFSLGLHRDATEDPSHEALCWSGLSGAGHPHRRRRRSALRHRRGRGCADPCAPSGARGGDARLDMEDIVGDPLGIPLYQLLVFWWY